MIELQGHSRGVPTVPRLSWRSGSTSFQYADEMGDESCLSLLKGFAVFCESMYLKTNYVIFFRRWIILLCPNTVYSRTFTKFTTEKKNKSDFSIDISCSFSHANKRSSVLSVTVSGLEDMESTPTGLTWNFRRHKRQDWERRGETLWLSWVPFVAFRGATGSWPNGWRGRQPANHNLCKVDVHSL